MTKLDTKNDNGGAWINIYKLPDKEIYWSGSVGYSTKEIAQYNNAGECYRIATLNIKDVLNQQAEINRLREALAQIINDVKYGEFVDLEAAKKALNGESEE